jgi:hypothetical protein
MSRIKKLRGPCRETRRERARVAWRGAWPEPAASAIRDATVKGPSPVLHGQANRLVIHAVGSGPVQNHPLNAATSVSVREMRPTNLSVERPSSVSVSGAIAGESRHDQP